MSDTASTARLPLEPSAEPAREAVEGPRPLPSPQPPAAAGSRARRALGAVGRFLRRRLTLVLFVALGVFLWRLEPAYNHVFGAYLVLGLLTFNLNLWWGELSILSLVVIFTNAGLCGWMLATGNADTVPYLGVILFGSMVLVALLLLALRRPLVFRSRERVAENYLDTGLRAVMAGAALAVSLRWMPHPNYIVLPVFLLLGFKLAWPVRRLLYPLLLRAVGLDPAAGSAATAAALQPGPGRGKLAVAAASLALAAGVALPLVGTSERYDVTVPEPYVLPAGYLAERQAQLEPLAASREGSLDPELLTELGLIYHNLGLEEKAWLERADETLDRAVLLDPTNARALAWHGSNQVAFALYEMRPVARVRLVDSGLAELGRAVALAPDDPEVRLARIDVCLGVPRFFGLLGTAREDVEHLLHLAQERPALTDDLLPLIHQRAGDLYGELGRWEEARCHWEKALAMWPPEAADARAMRARLERLRGERPGLADGAADAAGACS